VLFADGLEIAAIAGVAHQSAQRQC
jgi:hypothetical protein